jgi:GTP-binding protein HflX
MSDDFDDEDTHGGPQPFVDQRAAPTRVGLICPEVRGHSTGHSTEARKAEFEGLAEAIRVEVVFSDVIKVREIKPATFLGGGHVETLAQRVKDEEIELLLVDTALSPIQQRNLERETGAKVLDRTALILEIFGERAATREGVLQVELAHLNYQKSRLSRGPYRQGAQDAPAAAQASRRYAVPDRGAGRLYQCRQIEPVQRADRGRGVC